MSSQVVLPLGDLVAGAFERRYPTKRALECVALDQNGSAILWNQAGHGVEVTPEDQLAVVSLLLRKYVSAEHLEEAVVAGTQGGYPGSARQFKALANILIRIVPGEDFKTVLVEARRMQEEGTFKIPSAFQDVLRLHTTECALQSRTHAHGFYRLDLDCPIPLTDSVDEQARAYWRNAFVADCNETLADMFGTVPEDLIGKRIWELVLPHDTANQETVRSMVQKHYRGSALTYTHAKANGTLARAQTDTFGIVQKGALHRIWGRQIPPPTAEASTPNAIFLADARTGTVRGWDDTATAIFGYERNEALGRLLPIVEDWDTYHQLTEKVKERLHSLTFAEIILHHKQAHPVPCSVIVHPIMTAQGNMEALSFVATPLPQCDPSVRQDTTSLDRVIAELTTACVPLAAR